jgi:hypothetical protein
MRQITAVKRRFGSPTAATRNGWRGSYAPNTGHEGGRSARRFRGHSGPRTAPAHVPKFFNDFSRARARESVSMRLLASNDLVRTTNAAARVLSALTALGAFEPSANRHMFHGSTGSAAVTCVCPLPFTRNLWNLGRIVQTDPPFGATSL